MTTTPTEKSPFEIGAKVELTDKNWLGRVGYVGVTSFSEGNWVGVILDEAKGKNNGSVQGKQYFTCADNHGIFVRPGQVTLVGEMLAPKSGIRAPQQIKKNVTSNRTEGSASRLPRAGVSPSMSPSPSMEKLKAPSTKSGIKPSPSSERLKQSASNERIKQSPEKVKKGSPKMSPSPSQSSENLKQKDKQSSVDAKPSPPREAVAEKIAQFHKRQSVDRGGGDDGILRSVPADMNEEAELEYLRVEVKDLKEKLETLRAKRQEDKQKLTDYERCRIQLQQLLEFKSKMSDAHADLQRQLLDAKKEAKEAIESKENYQEEMSGISEAIEMATLDREMAEEKCELLQQELDSCKEKIKELDMDLEILKSEMENNEGSDGVENSIKVKQLQQQNERLKEALVKMRDISGHTGQESQRLLKEVESMKAEIADLSKKNDRLNVANTQYEQQMNDLKEQVDAALGAEEMVEQLTSKNLSMEERVRELEETIEDFEQMKMIDEEMQENARETERELRQEIDLASGRMNEVQLQLQRAADQMKDFEFTIKKFRQRTVDLQEEIQDLKDQVLTAEARARGDTDETDDVGDTDTSPTAFSSFAQTRSFSEVVDNELRKIDLDSSSQHVKYLKAFLPDNFGKAGGDSDGVLLTLFFPRISAKTVALSRQLHDRYPSVPGGMRCEHVVKSHKAEQWGFCAKFNYLLNALGAIVRKFESALSQCSVERLARLAQLQPEMSAQERQLDNFFELLKTNRLDENSDLTAVERIINYFQNIYSVHLASDEYDGTRFVADSILQLLSGTRWFKISLERLGFYLLENHCDSELKRCFSDLKLFIEDSEQYLVRIRNRLPNEKSEHVLKLPEQALERISETAGHLEKAANILHAACAAASTQVSMLPDVEGLDVGRLTELLQEGGEKVHGKLQDRKAEDLLKLSLGIIIGHSNKLAEAMDNGEFENPLPAESFPPLLERAHARKQDAVEADSLRWQLEKKENELMELKKSLRVRTEEISELKVRLEMAEKRLQNTGKEGDERLVRLQRRIDDLMGDLKKKDREYEQTMDALQVDLEGMEKENADLKDRIKMLSKKALLQGISREAAMSSSIISTSGGLPSPGLPVHDSPLLLQQIETLKCSLNASEQSRWRAEGERLRRVLASLRPLNVPQRPAGLQSQTALFDLDQSTAKKHDDLSHLLRETNRLQKEFVDFTSQNRVIDFTKKRPGTVPIIEKETAAFHLAQQVQRAKHLDDWMKDLNAKMQQFRAAQLPFWKATTDFGQFPKVDFRKAHERKSCVARISIPCNDPKEAGKTISVTMTPDQFRKIHQRLID